MSTLVEQDITICLKNSKNDTKVLLSEWTEKLS